MEAVAHDRPSPGALARGAEKTEPAPAGQVMRDLERGLVRRWRDLALDISLAHELFGLDNSLFHTPFLSDD